MRRPIILFFICIVATICACEPEEEVSVLNSAPTTNNLSLEVLILDDETTETGEIGKFSVRLNTQPHEEIDLEITCSDEGEGAVSPSNLSFTRDNYQDFQQVTVTGMNDDENDGDQVYTVHIQVTNPSFSGQTPETVSLLNIDDDTPGLSFGNISGATSEDGGTATFTLKLRYAPIADVTVYLSSSNTAEGAVDPQTIVFTTENWNSPQTITITGVNDDLQDGDQNYSVLITSVESADFDYDGLVVDSIAAINIDDDSPGFSISGVSGDTTEAGVQATFTVKLYCEPTDNVTFAISSTNPDEGIVSPNNLTFTPSDWDVEQTVTVTGQDDALDDDNQTFIIQLAAASSLDTDYHGLNPNDVSVINTDDDIAGYTVSAISGNTSEWGSTATFTVRLNSQPTANVNIGISSADTGEGTVSTPQLTFTPANWGSDQTVTATGANDSWADRDVSYDILLAAASSGDTKYDGENPIDVSVTNIDNEKIPDSGQTASYTAIFGEDNDYTFHTLSYSNNGDGTVTDNVTGLMWQRQDDDNTYNFADATSYCSILNLGDYSDWRLPTVKELIIISDFGTINPSINSVFTYTNTSFYWSSTSISANNKFFVVFQNPSANPSMYATDSYFVRCVRGEQTVIGFVDNGTTVTATNTGLIWQKGEGGTKTWESALTYCEGLTLGGQSDWRLPNVKQLHSLVDYSKSSPRIDTAFFPDATSVNYWSSSTVLVNTNCAYNVAFGNGSVSNSVLKTTGINVRCVRGGQ
jgi:hypothetical protein